ncbi:MAG: hypothetical protein Rubg2KO_36150 [Rubricoccaceae bacterium]
MPMRWLYRIQNRIGLAAPEGTAALVILIALAVGTVARHVQASTAPVAPDLYASSDAAFAAADRAAASGSVSIQPVVSATGSLSEPPSEPEEAVALADSMDVAPEPVAEPPAAPARRTARAAPARTGINTASAADLDRLPGIGPALAGRILAYRQQHGRFSRAEQLIEVKGIGPKTFEKMKPWVVID